MYDRYAGPLIAAQPRDLNVPREIARGYEKLGNVLGIEDRVAIGQINEAMTYYGKVVQLLQPFQDRGDLDRGGKAILGRTYCAIGRLREFAASNAGPGGADYAECLKILRQALNKTTYLREYLEAHAYAGDAALAFGNRAAASWHYEEILHRGRPFLAPKSNACFWLANGLLRRGRLNRLEGQQDAALADWKEALRLIRTGRQPAAADLFDVRMLELALVTEAAAVDQAFSAEAKRLAQTMAAAYPSHPLVGKNN
jgi:tetratricopeptide (TPR) repeat protein